MLGNKRRDDRPIRLQPIHLGEVQRNQCDNERAQRQARSQVICGE